jgi:hypothetical protein
MDRLKLSSEVLDLGRAIVSELGLDERNDVLARWMAHDVAAKISAADAPDATEETRAACADAILKLWAHRRDWPEGKRPFEDLEAVLKTLERLDPGRDAPSYFRPPEVGRTETDKWLEAAERVDQMARVLISQCLQKAVTAAEGDEAWADLANAVQPSREVQVRIAIVSPGEMYKEESEEVRRARALDLQLSVLKAFRRSASMVGKDLATERALLPAVPKPRRAKAKAASVTHPSAKRRRAKTS